MAEPEAIRQPNAAIRTLASVMEMGGADKADVARALMVAVGGVKGLAELVAGIAKNSDSDQARSSALATILRMIEDADDHSASLAGVDTNEIYALVRSLVGDLLPKSCPHCGHSLDAAVEKAVEAAIVEGGSA